jgi:hypothetical protein
MITVTHYKTGHMKLLYLSLGIVLLIGTSCSTNRNAAKYEADDRYFSLADARRENKQLKKLNQSSPTPSSRDAVVREENIDGYDETEGLSSGDNRVYDYSPSPQGDDKTVINNYYNDGPDYDMDNYYDYMYASRLRRFHNPRRSFFNYYDPFYTNMFWYNNDPFAFGNSIYSTYNFYNPHTPWGWNTWSPGVSIGWNSWNGWNMNMGWNSWGNPYAFNNPWRWNNWGYNPMMSPFSYNPYAFSPYGYGFNNFGGMGYMNGFNQGLSYGLMMNSMNTNPIYYNSFDNNTIVYGNVINYGPNTGGAGNGSGFVVAPNLTSQFSKEIGINYTPDKNAGKDGIPTQNNSGKPVLSNLQSVDQSTKPTVSQQSGGTGSGTTKPGSSLQTPSKSELGSAKPGNEISKPGSQFSSPGKGEVGSGKPVVNTDGTQQAKPGQSIQPSKGESFTPAKNTVQQPSQSIAPSGKDNLIQQGVVKPKADNYSSAPVQQMAKPSTDNRPETPFTRPANINSGIVRDLNAPTRDNTLQPARPNNQTKPAQQPYTPNYNYENGVRGNGNNAVTRPSEPVKPQTAPNFNNGARPNGNVVRPNEPVRPNNYAPTEQRRPESTSPAQRPNQPQQQFNQPRESRNAVVPRSNSYQQPSRSDEPRNNYQRPTEQPRQPSNQNYQTPQREQRNNSAQPQQRNNYSQPQQRQQFDQPSRSGGSRMESAPRNSAPQRSGSFESAPRGNSGGGSIRSSGGGSNNSGGKVNSPRR